LWIGESASPLIKPFTGLPSYPVPCIAMKSKLNQQTRLVLAFIILCVMTFGVLFTGPGFNFALQVIIASLMLFFLFWLVT